MLVQGRASFPTTPDRDWLESVERIVAYPDDAAAGEPQVLGHTLLGWCGSDEMPEVVPVTAVNGDDSGLTLEVPAGSVPVGGRRAGVTSHQFERRMIGQEQRVHTGWLQGDGSDRVQYAPHTQGSYRLPRSKLVFILGSASITFRMKKAREAGLAPPGTT